MTLDLDTFLTALYTIVDDLYNKHYLHLKPRRPGRRPRLSDSEVLTLAICAQWSGTSERAFQAIDTVPVPLMRRCRGQRHRLSCDEAAIGRGGSDRDWYYGCKLMVSVTPDGISTGFLLGPASTEDRWMAESFFCWRIDQTNSPFGLRDLPSSYRRNGERYVGPTGPIRPRGGVGCASGVPYVADNGFFGAWWQTHWREEYGAIVLTPKNHQGDDARSARREHSSWKQVVETVNGHLEQVFGLHFTGARSAWG
jgi:hypothetical protein